ncbi:hypothetical protein FN846DRAFT_957502 [Sphaerosporella brunnea]|uniref:Uncharacterized protein n=1 Tax=Sphaerosporella brunnea TaxID=1250544 RepID=A0A5J5ER17_9PEZI|nr:hypothetical protein FN846DRAFT_957502 [Sphaerosporella brunnea]
MSAAITGKATLKAHGSSTSKKEEPEAHAPRAATVQSEPEDASEDNNAVDLSKIPMEDKVSRYVEILTREDLNREEEEDRKREKEEALARGENPEEEEEEEEQDEDLPTGRIYFKGLDAEDTGSPARVSLAALERLCLLYNAADAQNPDLGEVIHMVRDAEGYAVISIFHGELSQYQRHTAQRKKSADVVMDLWPIVEALAFFLWGSDDAHWMHVDDGEGVRRLVEVFGAMYLDSLLRLDAEGFLRTDGPIKNLPLVMGIMLGLAADWTSISGEKSVGWAREILRLAQEKGIDLLSMTDKVEPYEPPPEYVDSDGDMDEQDEGEWQDVDRYYNFDKLLRAYKRRWVPWKDACIDLSKPSVKREIDQTLKEVSERTAGYTWEPDKV